MSVTEHMQEPVFGRRARWCIDPDRLAIRFSVGLMKVANVEGRFGELEGAVVLDDGAPHWSRADLFIEAASINTRNPVRDFHLRTKDYLDAKQFPCITFKSTHVVPLDDKTYRVTGDLTIRGVTREISLDVAHDGEIVELGARRRRFSAETRIYRKDFGIDPGVAGLGFLIGNEVTVRVRGEAVEQPRCGTDLREKSYEANWRSERPGVYLEGERLPGTRVTGGRRGRRDVALARGLVRGRRDRTRPLELQATCSRSLARERSGARVRR